MTRKAISIYMAATCAIVVVAPGRLVCGLIIAFELMMLMLFGLLFKALVKKMNLENLEQPAILSFVVFFTILTKFLITLLMPEVALQLGFVIFLPSISTFTTIFLLEEKEMTLKESLSNDLPAALRFSLYIILVSLIRDVVGFGTITLPDIGKQMEIILFSSEKVSTFTFLATIPGSLILNALLLASYLYVEKKVIIMRKAGIR